MITIDRIDRHTADITIDTLAIAGVPINTWREGGGPGFPSFDAVTVDWPAVDRAALPAQLVEALADADANQRLDEPLQDAYADFMRDAYANY